MAKVVFENVEPSVHFEKRVIYLHKNIPLRIGRPKYDESADRKNALFMNRVVSETHAYLLFKMGKFYLEDRSKNGTFINGFRLVPKKQFPLKSGDIIELGTDFFFNSGNEFGIILFVKLFPLEDDTETLMALQGHYSHPVPLYCHPPLFEIDMEMIQKCIYERLKIFQILSTGGERNRGGSEWILAVINDIKDKNLNEFYNMIIGQETNPKSEYIQKKKDHVSHFFLLLALCRNSFTRKLFIDQEIKLLQIRWHFLSSCEKKEFISLNNLYFEKISGSKLSKLRKTSNNELLVSEEDYYEVPFTEVSDLIKTRLVTLVRGVAVITLSQLIFPISHHFERALTTRLKHARENYQKCQDDERVTRILQNIQNVVRPKEFRFSNKSQTFSVSDIDQISKDSFPLCMEKLHRNLCTRHHLRHGGRYQYTLFLKGIGMSLHDSMKYWQHHFTKKISLNKFIKEYGYHIRHSYGMVGKQADYPPLNCKKILDSTPGTLDYHGCPFKREDRNGIIELLEWKGIVGADAIMIWKLMEEGKPQVACRKVFELTHNGCLLSSDSNSHPNIYYFESQKILQEQRKGKNTMVVDVGSINVSETCCRNLKMDW